MLGIGDDAALLRTDGSSVVAFSSDLLVEGVHFRLDWTTPELLGHKALAVSLSDMAAMGADPRACLLSLALPERFGGEFLDRFYTGALAVADKYGVVIAGGDLSSSYGPLVVDATLAGEVEESRALRRSGARPGDDLWVSGRLGSSAVGLDLLARGTRLHTAVAFDHEAILAHLAPEPRVALGVALARRSLATAAIDLSDGLSSDVRHLCDESGVGVSIESGALPCVGTTEEALHGGEQYELLFAARAADRERILALGEELGLQLTRVGLFGGDGVRLTSGGRTAPLPARGWDHFAGAGPAGGPRRPD